MMSDSCIVTTAGFLHLFILLWTISHDFTCWKLFTLKSHSLFSRSHHLNTIDLMLKNSHEIKNDWCSRWTSFQPFHCLNVQHKCVNEPRFAPSCVDRKRMSFLLRIVVSRFLFFFLLNRVELNIFSNKKTACITQGTFNLEDWQLGSQYWWVKLEQWRAQMKEVQQMDSYP